MTETVQLSSIDPYLQDTYMYGGGEGGVGANHKVYPADKGVSSDMWTCSMKGITQLVLKMSVQEIFVLLNRTSL